MVVELKLVDPLFSPFHITTSKYLQTLTPDTFVYYYIFSLYYIDAYLSSYNNTVFVCIFSLSTHVLSTGMVLYVTELSLCKIEIFSNIC